MIEAATRRKKSEALAQDEMKSLRRLLKQYPTDADRAEKLGIDRNTMNRVLGKGSGSPETIAKIREALTKESEG